jgi:hypothetical protein
MKKLILAGALALGLLTAGSSFANTAEAALPSEHSLSKTSLVQYDQGVQALKLPSEH